MAISAPTQRTVGAASAVTNSNTASFTPAANALQLAFVHTARAAGASNVPTMTRSALSWTWIAGVAYLATGTRRRLDVFAQMEAAPVANVANIAYAGQTQDTIQWEILDVAGTASTIATAIRQAVTREQNVTLSTVASVTMAPFANAANATILGVGVNTAATLTAGTFYTVVGQGTSGANAVGAERRLLPDRFPSITLSGSSFYGAIGLELVSAVGAASGTLTMRPDSTVDAASWALVVAATHHAAQSDDLDTTYSWTANPTGGTLALGMQDLWSAVYNTRLVSLTQRMRAAAVTGVYVNYLQGIRALGTTEQRVGLLWPASGTQTLSYVWDTAPDGDAWTITTAFDLQLLYSYSAGDSNLRVFESYVDLLFNDRPTATLTAPVDGSTITTTTRPTFTWTYSDPEGDAQERWRIDIFTDAQYLAGGFDPLVTVPYTTSGDQTGGTSSWVPTIDLPNDVYRAYVRVSDVGASGVYGLQTYVGWTQNVTAPTVPTLTANPENAAGRIRLFVQGSGIGAGDPPHYFDIEYSDDGGTTWTAVRNGSTLTPSATYAATAYDYEAPPGVVRSYRAKAVRLVGTLAIGSAWSSTATATQTLALSWLKDPLDPTLNYAITCGPFIEAEERKERVGVFEPYGADFPVIVAGSLMGWDGMTTIYATSLADRAAVEALLDVQHSLLFQDAEGTNRYLRLLTRRRDRRTCDVWSYPVTYLETEAP